MIDETVVCKMYAEGQTIDVVAKQLNYSYRRVREIVNSAGILRTRGEGALLSMRQKSSRPDTCRIRARNIWKYFNGPIPEKHHIHHKDGDPTNNNIDNLECISSSDHTKLHKPWITSRDVW